MGWPSWAVWPPPPDAWRTCRGPARPSRLSGHRRSPERRCRRRCAAQPSGARPGSGHRRPPGGHPAPAGEALAVPGKPAFAVEGMSPYVTPTDDFYRIDTALVDPAHRPGWLGAAHHRHGRSAVRALLRRAARHGLDRGARDAPVRLQRGRRHLVGNAVWQGVPLGELLDRAGVAARRHPGRRTVGRRLHGRLPHRAGLDGRTALVAYAMNGEPLPGPARVPGSARGGRPLRLRLGHQVAGARSSWPAGRTSTATGSRGAGPRRVRSR